MGRKLPGWAYTIVMGTGIGLVILGIGGRLAMHAIAELTTGTSRYTVGGTATVVALGAASGALGGLILAGARGLFRRWPPVPSLLYWGLLAFLTIRGLNPLDELRAALFVPPVLIFGIALQWATWSRRASGKVGLAPQEP